jgi:Peptidase A4 family
MVGDGHRSLGGRHAEGSLRTHEASAGGRTRPVPELERDHALGLRRNLSVRQWRLAGAHRQTPGPPTFNTPRMATTLVWVGIDGWQTLPLVQAGTASTVSVGPDIFGYVTASFYGAWQEVFPEYPTLSFIPDLPISPNDQMTCQVYRANPGGLPNPGGTHVFVVLTNLTRQASGVGGLDLGGTLDVHCRQAEWILSARGSSVRTSFSRSQTTVGYRSVTRSRSVRTDSSSTIQTGTTTKSRWSTRVGHFRT